MLLTLYLQLRIVTKSKILPFRNEKIVHCLLNTFFLNCFCSLALEGDNNSNSNSSSGATTTETLQRPIRISHATTKEGACCCCCCYCNGNIIESRNALRCSLIDFLVRNWNRWMRCSPHIWFKSIYYKKIEKLQKFEQKSSYLFSFWE